MDRALRLGWFSGFGRRQAMALVLFAFAVPLTGALFRAVTGDPMRDFKFVNEVIACFITGGCALLAATIAENRLGRWPLALRMALAVIGAALAASAAIDVAALLLRPLGVLLEESGEPPFTGTMHRYAYHFSGAASWALILVALSSMFEAQRRAARQLVDARLSALAAERELVEADLRAMQARVDPDFLFAALLAVDEAYVKNGQAGEQALDAVIAYLRAALPAETSAASTVAAEVHLLQAYLAVAQLCSSSRLRLELAVDPSVDRLALPAMLVLPLARWALNGAPAAALRVAAQRREGVLEIGVGSDVGAEGAADADSLAGVRGRLTHLYGERARLDVAVEPRGRHALIGIPLAG
jgi:hypothetical protein